MRKGRSVRPSIDCNCKGPEVRQSRTEGGSPLAFSDPARRTTATLLIVGVVSSSAGALASKGCPTGASPSPPGWIERAASRALPPELDGPIAGVLVGELTTVLCDDPHVRSWFTATCAPVLQTDAVTELRRRLIRDLGHLPLRQLALETATMSEVDRTRAGASAALVAAAVEGDRILQLARRLEILGAYGAAATVQDACLAPPPTLPSSAWAPQLYRAGELIAVVARYVATDAPDPQTLHDRAANIAASGSALSPLQQRALDALVADVRAGASATDERAVASLLFETVEHALTVVTDRHITLSGPARELVSSLSRGNLQEASDSLLLLVRGWGLRARSGIVDALRASVRLASARTVDEAKRVVLELVVPVGPWARGVLFEVNGGLPRTDSDDFRFAGDALLGYNFGEWGFAARGAIAAYDLQTEDVLADSQRFSGGGDAWYAGSLSRELRAEARLSGSGAVYDTQTFPQAAGAASVLADETSVMGRGRILLSLRYEPSSRLALGVWAGAGWQLELYDRIDVSGTGSGVVLEEESHSSLIVQGRLRGQYALIERYLVTRLRADAERYGITRDALRTDAVGGETQTAEQSVTAAQWEVSARIFLDAEFAKVADFVPGLFAGLDYFSLTGDTPTPVSVVVPLAGVGIRRIAF